MSELHNGHEKAPRPGIALSMPTLVIAGTKDMIKDSHTRQIADSIPGDARSILEGDHFIAAKNSGAFNASVMNFLV